MVYVMSPGTTVRRSRGTSRLAEESERKSETRPRSRTLTVSGTDVVMTRSRGMPTSANGTANARSETLSRLGAETTNQTVNASRSDSSFSDQFEIQPFTPLPEDAHASTATDPRDPDSRAACLRWRLQSIHFLRRTRRPARRSLR